MTDRLLPFRLFNDAGELTTADQISVDQASALLPDGITDAQEALGNLQGQINTIVVPTPPSFRPFRVFNGGTLVSNVNFRIEEIILDSSNLATWNDINSIYAAGRVDKIVDIYLPTDAEIAASGVGYPVAIEITHLGGTARLNDRNLVRMRIAAGDTGTQIDTVALGLRSNTALLQGDIGVFVKNGAGQNWQESRRANDPSENLLPEGVFDLQTDTVIQNIANISTELSGVAITSGEAYLVETGGFYFGADIQSGDVVVAKVDTPDLTTNSDDWLLIRETRNGAISMDHLMLLNQFVRSGTRYDANRNIFVNESNVIEFNSQASGTPLTLIYFTTDAASPGTGRVATFSNQPIQFSDLVGGTMRMGISTAANSQSGFAPELQAVTFDFSGTTFQFPISGLDPVSGNVTVDITIPNQDYSAILNSNCNITLNYQFRGESFIGTFTINGLVNILDGTLRNAVTSIADASAAMSEQRVGTRIDNLAHDIDNDGAALQAIQPRISPFKSVTTNTPDVNALFLDSTGSDSFPADLSSMSQVSAQNPRFTGGNVALYVAVISPGATVLRNITTSSDTALDSSDPAVTLGESRTLNNNTYFVYRVTGLTSGHVYEVERQSREQVVAWPDDIRNLQDDVNRIDAELTHAALNLPDALVHILENEVTVTEESTPTTTVTEYNEQLAGPSNTTQTVYRETSPNAPSGGALNSKPISDTAGTARARQKLVYFPAGIDYQNQAYLTAFDGTTGRDLIRYTNGVFKAQVFVPAIPASTRTENVYPAPAARVSGAGIWQNIPTLTFQNGIPVPEADELFFTRNIPSSSTALTVQYRGHANGNVFGENTGSLAGVGGSNEVFTDFTLTDGSETVTIEVRWYPSSRQIRVSATERVFQGLPTINDVEVILSFSETRTVPATPATTREVDIEFEHPGGQVFAIKPSDQTNLVIVGDRQEIDTGFAYTTLFGAGEGGHLTAVDAGATFLDYQDFDPIPATVTDLENHARLPQFGLFSTEYTRETDLNIGVTIKPTGFNVGDLPTSATGLASGDVWNNSGTLTIVP